MTLVNEVFVNLKGRDLKKNNQMNQRESVILTGFAFLKWQSIYFLLLKSSVFCSR